MSPLAEKIREANSTLIEDGDFDSIARFFTDDYVVHLTERDMKGGHDTVRKVLTQLRKAFPDIQVEVEILVEGKDRVAWQRTLRGTQKGAYQGFPASGRALVWRDLLTTQFRDGLIAEEWFASDLAEQLLRSRKS